MKKYFLYVNLIAILATVWTVPALAEKKYRYIKREHGVKFQGSVPVVIANPLSFSADFKGAYAYNWKGFAEVGPYFQLALDNSAGFSISKWAVGILGEYNFIKNRGKRKFIPSVGIQFGVTGGVVGSIQGMGGVHASLKSFVAKRTAFITNLQYDLVAPFNFSTMSHQVGLDMGFAYYFDFY